MFDDVRATYETVRLCDVASPPEDTNVPSARVRVDVVPGQCTVGLLAGFYAYLSK